MKTMKHGQSVPIFSGITNKYTLNAVILSLLLWGFAAIAHAQASDGGAAPAANTTDTNGVSVVSGLDNTPVAQIQASMDKIKKELVVAVKQMEAAVHSNPQQQVDKVTNLAKQLRELATNDLGDSSEIVKNADALVAKMKSQLLHARASASDPNVGAREIYLAVATKLEPEISKLIDARASVNQIRSELLRKADGLDQNAAAIGFAADADQTALAANAFSNVLTDIVKFTSQIEAMINNVTKVPVT